MTIGPKGFIFSLFLTSSVIIGVVCLGFQKLSQDFVKISEPQTINNKTLSDGTTLPEDYYGKTYLNQDQDETASGKLTLIDAPQGKKISDGPLYINPPIAEENSTLFGIAVGEVPVFKVDSEGDIAASGNLTTNNITTYNLGTTDITTDNLTTDNLSTTNLTTTNLTTDNLNASSLNSGTIPSGRLQGSYTGITGLGTVILGTWQGTVIGDAYLSDTLTASNYLPLTGGTITGDLTVQGILTGETSLDIQGNTTLGKTSSDKFTINSTSEFLSPVSIKNTLTVGTSTLTIDASGNLTTTGSLSAVSISGTSISATSISATGAISSGSLSSGSISGQTISASSQFVEGGTSLSSKYILIPSSSTQGDILYHDGSSWKRLAAGSSGQLLRTMGASANPQWATVSLNTAGGWSDDGTVVRLETDTDDVGIGTSTPSAKLHSLSAGTAQLRLGYDASNYTNFDVQSNGDLRLSANGGSTTLTLTASGNVGIGTTTPSESLTVVGDLGLRNGSLWQPVYGTDDGLILHWPFSEATGTTVYDHSSNGNDGTLGNATWTNGKYGSGVNFDKTLSAYAASSAVLTPDNLTSFSVEFWIKTSTITSNSIGLLVGKGGFGGWSNGFRILRNTSTGTLIWEIYSATGSVGMNSSETVHDGNWHHLSFVLDGTTMVMYKDGVVIDNGNFTGSINGNWGIFVAGRNAADSTFSMDELKIYKRALSSDEVRTQYLRGPQTNVAVVVNTSTNANNTYGTRSIVKNTGIVTTGTDSTYGSKIDVTRTGATGGIINSYGQYVTVVGDIGGTSQAIGGYFSATGAINNYGLLVANGNVGIGTTGPTSILALGGDAARTFQMERGTVANTAGYALTVKAGGATSGATDKAGGDLYLASGISTGAGVSNIYFQTATAGATGTADRTPSTKMTILGNGNVGIGTTSPATKLQIVGTDEDVIVGIKNINSVSARYPQFTIDHYAGSTLGHPIFAFNVARGSESSPLAVVNTQNIGSLDSWAYDGSAFRDSARISFLAEANFSANYNPAGIAFFTGGNGNITERMRIRSETGNVGIGTTSPTSILALGGDAARTFQMERGTVADTAGYALTVKAGGATSGATDKAGGDLYLASGISTGTGASNLYFQTVTAGAAGTTDNTPSTKMTILGNGNVGIGTSGPKFPLTVAGGGATIESSSAISDGASAISIQGPGAAYFMGRDVTNDIEFIMGTSTAGAAFAGSMTAHDFQLRTDNATRVTVKATTGNVGIGDTTPASLLTVGNGDLFQVDTNGDIIKLKNLTYSWPSAHTANGVLTDNGSGTLTWATVGASGITADSLDFTEFQDTLDLDADLILNQAAYTWTQNFTGTTTTGLTYNANSLTSGGALSMTSTATGFTGTMADIILSGNNAANTGTLLKVSSTGALNTGVPLMVTNLGAGISFRVNDETGDADTTPFVINASGNVGIGTASPGYKLDVNGNSNITGWINTTVGFYGVLSPIGSVLRQQINTGAQAGGGAGPLVYSSGNATYTGGYHAFNVDGNEKLRIDNSGNVGIGTTTPSEKLTIRQDSAGNLLGLYDGANNTVLAIADSGQTTFKPSAFDTVYTFDGASAYADNTAEAKTSAGTAFTILALEASSNDEFYLGLDHPFNTVYFDIAAAGAGVTLSAQYYSTAWTALTLTADNTANLTVDGSVTFTAPSNWTATAINGVTKYWIRLRSPATNITVAPTAYSVSPTTGNRFYVYGQAGDTNPALYVNGKGNVGIGTASPDAKLVVTGSGGTLPLKVAKDSSDFVVAEFYNNSNWLRFIVGQSASYETVLRTFRGGGDYLSLAMEALDFRIKTGTTGTGGFAERMRVTSSGLVGIGTVSPSALLNLKGNLSSALTGTVAVTNLSAAVVGTGALFTTELAVGDSIKIGTEVFTVSAITDALNLTLDSAYQGATASGLTAYRDPTLFAIDNGDAVNKLTITKSGNVGIGTASPTRTLFVNGYAEATSFYANRYNIGSGTGAVELSGAAMQLLANDGFIFKSASGSWATKMRILDSGNVGIGTVAPGSKLTVAGTITLDNTIVVSGALADAPATGTCAGQTNSASQAVFQTSTSVTSSHIFYNSTRTKHARITSVATCVDGSANTWQILTLTDSITGNAAADNYTVYNPAGDLGTSSAGFANNLYAVNGKFVTATVSGGFDIAEEYQTNDGSIEVGDIVSVDPSNSFFIAKSSVPNDEKLLGVISTNPGLSLGNETIGIWRKVALSGRVAVKVSAENGPIAIGDYLTSSSTPGVAMKATEPGRVIGMALENFTPESISNSNTNNLESNISDNSSENSRLISEGKVMVFVNPTWYMGSFDEDGTLAESDQSSESANQESGILESFIESVKQSLASLGMTIENGVAQLKELVVEKFTAKKAHLDRMEMVDQATGEIYCTWIENGEWVKVKSSCDEVNQKTSPSPAD